MSADSHAVCPKCKAREETKHKLANDRLAADYGKVPLAEWEDRRAKLESETREPGTLREFYEVYGAETGTVTVEYSALCDECGFEPSFVYKQPIL